MGRERERTCTAPSQEQVGSHGDPPSHEPIGEGG